MEMFCTKSGNFRACRKIPKKPHGFRFYCGHCKKYVKEDEWHGFMGTELERWFLKAKSNRRGELEIDTRTPLS